MRAGQFGGDQRPFIGVDLLAETAVRRRLLGRRAGERVLQAQLQTQGKALGGVLQLAHIARPAVAQQLGAGWGGQFAYRHAVAGTGGVGKVLEQAEHIVAPFAQRRDAQRGDVQAVIQVGAKAALVGAAAQVFLAGGDDADIQGDQLVAAEAFDYPLLQQAQQLDLYLQAHAFDFIEKQGAAVGKLELADAAFLRAGKGAGLVAEQLAFHHRLGQGAGIDGDEGAVAAAGVIVQGAGHHLFAGAGFAKDQHVGVDRRQGAELFAHALHGR